MSSAAAALIRKPKRCPKCGETDVSQFSRSKNRRDGLACWCRSCTNAAVKRWRLKPNKGKRNNPSGLRLKVVCGGCGTEFAISPYHYKRRVKQKLRFNAKANDTLYCSKPCAALVVNAHGPRRTLKQKRWTTDSQHYWNQLLHDVGLGLERGYNSAKVIYGLHRFYEEVGSDGVIRIKVR